MKIQTGHFKDPSQHLAQQIIQNKNITPHHIEVKQELTVSKGKRPRSTY